MQVKGREYFSGRVHSFGINKKRASWGMGARVQMLHRNAMKIIAVPLSSRCKTILTPASQWKWKWRKYWQYWECKQYWPQRPSASQWRWKLWRLCKLHKLIHKQNCLEDKNQQVISGDCTTSATPDINKIRKSTILDIHQTSTAPDIHHTRQSPHCV